VISNQLATPKVTIDPYSFLHMTDFLTTEENELRLKVREFVEKEVFVYYFLSVSRYAQSLTNIMNLLPSQLQLLKNSKHMISSENYSILPMEKILV
jgi:hypothetical protein